MSRVGELQEELVGSIIQDTTQWVSVKIKGHEVGKSYRKAKACVTGLLAPQECPKKRRPCPISPLDGGGVGGPRSNAHSQACATAGLFGGSLCETTSGAVQKEAGSARAGRLYFGQLSSRPRVGRRRNRCIWQRDCQVMQGI